MVSCRIKVFSSKMTSFLVTLINVIVSSIDLILYPINFLIYKKPWKLPPRRPYGYQPHQLIFCGANSSQVLLKPSLPEPTCENSHAMKTAGVDTMNMVLEYMMAKYGNRPCLGYRKVLGTRKYLTDDGTVLEKIIFEDRYTWQSYHEIHQRVFNVAKGIYSMGIRPKDKLLIYADTSPEWLITALACFKSSVTIVTLYTNLGDEGIIYGINQVQVHTLVTNQSLLPKILSLKEQLPHLKTVIVFVNHATKKVIYLRQNHITIVPFPHVESRGTKMNTSQLKQPTPDSEAVIMYTSGSTGEPKGVILTHKNLTSSLMGCCIRACNLMGYERYSEEVYLAYLPLAHIFEITQEIIVLSLGIKVGYSSPHTLTDTSTAIMPGHRGDISILRPTVMAAVPLILDRIYKSFRSKVGQKGQSFQEIFDFCVAYRVWWLRKGYDTPFLNRVLFGKIRNSFGGHLKAIIAGGAPLSPNVHNFLRATLGINLAQGYGLTESNGGITLSTAEDLSVGRVGNLLPGVQLKLKDWVEGGYMVLDQTGHGPRGEILLGGPMIASGYYQLPEKTEESFYVDPNDGLRWFRTGDIGQIDTQDAVLRIIDRKKDLVKLQMGEYVSLGKVEACLKIHPLIDNICVIADSSKTYCVALVIPDMARLTELAIQLELCLGYKELCENPLVIESVTGQLQRHAKGTLQKFEIPQKFALISNPWTPDTGLVTSSMKLKRKAIQAKYFDIVHQLYQN